MGNVSEFGGDVSGRGDCDLRQGNEVELGHLALTGGRRNVVTAQ